MAESLVRETAQIIPFPGNRRLAKSSHRDAKRASVERLPPHIAICDFGSGWYHDEAIQEEALKHSPH